MINKKIDIVFSPTGGTQKVVQHIGSVWDAPEEIIDLCNAEDDYENYHFDQQDLCIVGVPSFGGRVPVIAIQRLSKMKGNKVPTVLAIAFGNRAYDDTVLELKECMMQAGFKVIAAVAAVTEHSIMHQFATGRPDVKDIQELQAFGHKIKAKMNIKDCTSDIMVKGKHPYRIYNGVPFKPQANHKCNACGKCASNCPVSAISKDNCKITDTQVCISCMRCVSICPNGARNISGLKLTIAGMKMKKACLERKNNELFI